MRVKLGWVPRLFSILFIIATFVCLNVLWTTSSLAFLTSKSAYNASRFRLSFDTVYVANTTGRADAIKSVLATNNDLKFLETGYLSKNISTATSSAPQGPRYFLTTLQLGQLGNNMFQYAGLLGLSKMNGRTPVFPASSLVRQVFKISHVDSITEASTWRRLGEANFGKYEAVYEHLPEGNLTLAAYLQSYKYFQSMEKEVRQEFQFREGIQRRAMGLIKFLRPRIGMRTPIGVHARRNDLLTQKEVRQGSLTAPKAYFDQAFAWMRSRHGDVVFLVATDDPAWCKENILQGDDVILLPHATADVHLCALAACRHVIMSVGTFGWWAGWLGGGDVIYYTKPHAPGSMKDKMFSREDFFPLHWIGIGDDTLSAEPQTLEPGSAPLLTPAGDTAVPGPNTARGVLGNTDGVPSTGLGGGAGSLSQQKIASGVNSQLSPQTMLSNQQNISPGLNNQLPPKELWSNQPKIPSSVDIRGSPETLTLGQPKTNPVLEIQGSPEGMRQMLINKGLVQGGSQEQNPWKTGFQNLVKFNAAETPNVLQNMNEPSVLVKGNPVISNPVADGASPSGVTETGVGGDTLPNVLESVLGKRTDGNPVDSAISPSNALENANLGKNLADEVSSGVGGNIVQSNVNLRLPREGNLNMFDSGIDVKGLTGNTKNLNFANKFNPSLTSQTLDPAREPMKPSVTNIQLGGEVKASVAADDKLSAVNPQITTNLGTNMFKVDGSQVLKKLGLVGANQGSMSTNLGEATQTGTVQNVENKAIPGLL